MRSSEQKNLVMGAALGYSVEQIRPFLQSLRSAGYEGQVALIVTPDFVSEAKGTPLFERVAFMVARQWLPFRIALPAAGSRRRWRWGTRVIPYWILVRLLRVAGLESLSIILGKRLYPPSESRYLHYYSFLKKHDYRRVLISDTRDVVFQCDPFTTLPEQGLGVSMEPPNYSIDEEPSNSGWIRVIYGADELKAIGGNQVSCSGVSYGDRASMLRYLGLMLDEIFGLGLRTTYRATTGFDQGMHNHLLWRERLEPTVRLYALESPIATIGGFAETDIPRDDSGRILNRDGRLSSVVHQYDRHPQLEKQLMQALEIS